MRLNGGTILGSTYLLACYCRLRVKQDVRTVDKELMHCLLLRDNSVLMLQIPVAVHALDVSSYLNEHGVDERSSKYPRLILAGMGPII